MANLTPKRPVLIIDNYDSFVYNVADYCHRTTDAPVIVRRHDAVSLHEVHTLNPSHILLSPGPKGPDDAGICADIIKACHQTTPILGICLGHQVMGAVFGHSVLQAQRPIHGQSSPIVHNAKGLFAGLPSPMMVGRYHSLHVQADGPLLVDAKLQSDQTVMALRHAIYPCYGVQFHPESVLTPLGLQLISNFFALTRTTECSPVNASAVAV